MSNEIIQIGLSSCEKSGSGIHYPLINLNPNFNLSSICQDKEHLAKHPHIKYVASFDRLLSDKYLDVIVINSAPSTHFERCKETLLAGKHAILETPFGISKYEVLELVSLAKNNGLSLAILHLGKLESGFKTLEHLTTSNKLGKISYFKSHFNLNQNEKCVNTLNDTRDTTNKDFFYTHAPALINQALALFGTPIKVSYQCKKQSEVLNNSFLILLEYGDQLIVELEAGTFSTDKEPRYVLKGEKGNYTKKHRDHQKWLLQQGIYPASIDPDKGKIKETNGFITEIENIKISYSEFYTNFYNYLTKGSELNTTLEEAINVIEIMELCIKKEKL